MMRFLFLFLLIFPLFVLAEPGKVVGVIPVKFNSKGMHAPVPYNQQLMDRGWTRVPTLNLPFTFADGAGQNPRYQPTKVTKKSFARALGYAAGRAANMTPAGKALLIGYGAYEANCMTQNFPSLCVSDEFDPNADLAQILDYQDAKRIDKAFCASAPPPLGGNSVSWGCDSSSDAAVNKAAVAYKEPLQSACMSTGTRTSCTITLRSVGASAATYDQSYTYLCQQDMDPELETCSSNNPSYRTQIFSINSNQVYYVCPPEDLNNPVRHEMLSKYVRGPYKVDGSERCFKPSTEFPVTPEWIEGQMDANPDPVKNSDVGLDDFVDWETGLPRPDAFEDPQFDPVSKAFADAAEAIANGTVQHDNPNADGYVPRDMMPNLLVQINNWHEGNTFTDVFTGKPVQPDAPPPEDTNIDWSKFPGITKAQYEASNNAWGNAAVNGKPDINSELDKLTQEQQKLTDFINEPLPDLPYEIDFPSLFQLPTTGQCRGFTVRGSVSGTELPIIVDTHCPPYEAWGRPVIDWFLGIMTIFQCFHIFRRTIEVA